MKRDLNSATGLPLTYFEEHTFTGRIYHPDAQHGWNTESTVKWAWITFFGRATRIDRRGNLELPVMALIASGLGVAT